jgi:hypothetical protein
MVILFSPAVIDMNNSDFSGVGHLSAVFDEEFSKRHGIDSAGNRD